MHRLVLLLTLFFLAPLTAHAQDGQTRPGERFLIALPEAWAEVARSRQQGADVIAYVPRGQDAESWTDMLTLQVYSGMTALPAQAFYERSLANVQKVCDGAQAADMQSGLSNGYPSAFWVLGCGRNRATGVGETSFFRLIQGDGALYMAQRTWRTETYTEGGPPVTPQETQAAIELLSSFSVCNPQAPDHPCPALDGR